MVHNVLSIVARRDMPPALCVELFPNVLEIWRSDLAHKSERTRPSRVPLASVRDTSGEF